MSRATLQSIRLDARAMIDPRASITLTAHNGAPVYAVTTEHGRVPAFPYAFRLSTGVECYCYAPTLDGLSRSIRNLACGVAS